MIPIKNDNVNLCVGQTDANSDLKINITIVMKRMLLIFVTSLFIAVNVNGQTRVSIYAGYGISQFDDGEFEGDQIDQTGYFPAGACVEFGMSKFTFGIEGNYSILPFNFDLNVPEFGKAGEYEITQLVLGGFVKFRFRDKKEINPYVRGGFAYYGGKGKITFTDEFKQNFTDVEDSELEFKAAIGFNAGIGMDFPVSPVSFIFIEADYHFVQRKADQQNAESFQANNFAFYLGYSHIL